MDTGELIELWRAMLAGVGGAWVLFEHGTCVTLSEPGDDPAREAAEVLRASGPAGDGPAIADFAATVEIPDGSGWVVASQHADINTFVGRFEVDPETPDAAIGRLGRSKREQDMTQPRVVHVEDGRA